MFIELIDGEKKALCNINIGTKLSVFPCSSKFRVTVVGPPAFGEILYEGYKSGAENLYNKLRNQWVGSEHVEVINK